MALRSLDPDTGFESPKSKKLRPTSKVELSRFSEGELDGVARSEKRAGELAVSRAVQKAQRDAVRKNAGLAAE